MEEENRSFRLSGLFIKIALVIIFILFTVWLLSLSNKGVSDSLDVLTNEIFAENLEKMKKVGKEYFTKDKLPSKIGGIEKLTLKEMYEKKLLVEIKDKNGDVCSEENSYISVEKFDNEYQMKVYLECNEEKDHVIITINCSEFGTCTAVDNAANEYEYKKVSGGSWGKWSDWSAWSTIAVSKLDNRDVETKVEKETNTYTEEETIIDYKDVTKVCPEGYELTTDKTSCYKTVEETKNPVCDKNANFVSQNGLNCKYIEEEKVTLTCPAGYVQSGTSCKKTTSTLKLLDTVKPVCPQKEGYYTMDRNGFECIYKKYTKGNFIEPVIITEYDNAPQTDEEYYYERVEGSGKWGLIPGTTTMGWTYVYGKYESITKTEIEKAVCSKEYIEDGDTCKKYEVHTDTVEEPLVCEAREGYALTQNGTTCTYKKEVTTKLTCPSGYTEKDNACVKATTTFENYTSSCPVGYTETEDGTKCEKEVTTTVTKTEEIEITYYRYRLREYLNGTTLYKWSSSKEDKNLLNAGYKLTGKTR